MQVILVFIIFSVKELQHSEPASSNNPAPYCMKNRASGQLTEILESFPLFTIEHVTQYLIS